MPTVAATDHKLTAWPIEIHPLHCEQEVMKREDGIISMTETQNDLLTALFCRVVYTLYSLFKIIFKSSTCGIIAVTLISPEIVCPITVVGVKQVDVFIIVTSQELWTYRKCQTAICLISFNAIKAEASHDFHNF